MLGMITRTYYIKPLRAINDCPYRLENRYIEKKPEYILYNYDTLLVKESCALRRHGWRTRARKQSALRIFKEIYKAFSRTEARIRKGLFYPAEKEEAAHRRERERFGSCDLPLERITKFQTYVSKRTKRAFNNIFFQFSGKLGDSERQEHDVRKSNF